MNRRFLSYCWEQLTWTKKIPASLKNKHRAFWGMKPLPVPANEYSKWQLTLPNGDADEVEFPTAMGERMIRRLLREEYDFGRRFPRGVRLERVSK